MSARASIETVLMQAWMRRGWLARILWPLSCLLLGLSSMRRWLYARGWLRSTRLPVPVIVVGNIFVGGTGKTPLCIWLVDALRRAGYTPGVISRGYGTQGAAPQRVIDSSSPQQVGDEPVLIAQRAQCPVVVSRDRVAAGLALLSAHPEVNLIVSDDGLQHYALARDLEILLFDARGLGNGWLLPAGPLREPASRGRDITVLHAAGAVPGMPADAFRMQLCGTVAQRLADPTQTLPLAQLGVALPQGDAPRIAAAAGIGNPARFFAMLRAAGLNLQEFALPDHYDFADNPFTKMSADRILITEKDAVKCRQIMAIRNDPRLWVVPVAACIDDALSEQIQEKLRGHPTA